MGALLLWPLAGPPARAAACRLAFVTSVPMHLLHNRLVVPITLGAHADDIVLDTGSTRGALSHITAMAVHARSVASVGSHLSELSGEGIGGYRQGFLTEVSYVRLGQLTGSSVPFVVIGGGRERGEDPDLLGIDFLADDDIDLDIAGGRLTIYQGQRGCAHAATTLHDNLYMVPQIEEPWENRIFLPVTVSGHRLQALLDTGAPRSALLADGAEKLGVAPPPGGPRETVTGVGPKAEQAYSETSAPMQIGDLTMAHARLDVLPDRMPHTDMILGMDFISRTHIWISNSSRTLVIQVPPAPSPPPP